MTTEDQHLLFEAAVAQSPPYPDGRFSGRGIVICAGGSRLFTCAYVAIGILRRVLRCRLPIQLWHLGPAEIGPPMRALLESFEVEVVDALAPAGRDPMRIVGGWELKPYALAHSRFREVFLLDADNVALIDPERLFELPQYAAAGAVFWPDLVRLRADNPIWAVCGVAYRDLPSVESGQLLVDKHRCWAALQLTLHMNRYSDFFYQHVYGDKDTFLMAWLRMGREFAMPPHPPLIRHQVINQHGFDGRVIFQHRNAAKWSYGHANRQIPDFELESECLDLLAELQEQWNGRVFNPPLLSAPARALAASLEKIEWFTYLKVGSVKKEIQLLAGNRIGAGRAVNEFYWWVEEDSEGMLLGIEGRHRPGDRLRPMPDGSWRGHSREPEAWETLLVPRSASGPAEEPVVASAVALLASIMASPAGRAADGAAVRDLTATLRTLRAAVPGFATALSLLSTSPAGGGVNGAALGCLRAVLAEPQVHPLGSSWVPDDGQGSSFRVFNLKSHYERNK